MRVVFKAHGPAHKFVEALEKSEVFDLSTERGQKRLGYDIEEWTNLDHEMKVDTLKTWVNENYVHYHFEEHGVEPTVTP